jgi:hypothetical protein
VLQLNEGSCERGAVQRVRVLGGLALVDGGESGSNPEPSPSPDMDPSPVPNPDPDPNPKPSPDPILSLPRWRDGLEAAGDQRGRGGRAVVARRGGHPRGTRQRGARVYRMYEA